MPWERWSFPWNPGAATRTVGDQFDVLQFGALSGIFESLNLPALGPGLLWDNSQLLTNGILSVIAGLQGDFNGDGLVDASDYTVWRD